jgi:hypothetical protein
LLSARLYKAVLTAFAVFSAVLCFIPLFNVLGYEFSVAVSVILWLAGGVFIAAVSQAGRLRRNQVPPGAIFKAVFILLLVPIIISAANAIRVTNCSWPDGVAFYMLIPCVTGFILAAFASAAVAIRSPAWLSIVFWYLAGGLEIGWRLLEIYRGPQTFFYSHVIGFFPGPLYDEALRAGWPLSAFRAGSLLLGCMLLAAALFFLRRIRTVPAVLAIACCAAAFGLLQANGDKLGFVSGRMLLERELEGLHRTARFDIRYQQDPSVKRDIQALAAMHEFHLSEIEKVLGIRFEGRIVSYVFKGPAEKKALTGAGPTNIAKPWLREIYVNLEQFPYGTLRHEIAHVVMGTFPANSLKIPGRLGGIIPNIGLVEGAAVALEFEGPDLMHHQMARVMLDNDLLPDMEKIFAVTGFYSLSAGRAYSAAGSLMRWLLETEGPGRFIEVYKSGDLEKTYSRPIAGIVDSWKKFLGKVPPDIAAEGFWSSQFRRPAIFGITCAHEAASARHKAGENVLKGRPGAALEELRSLCKSACAGTDRKMLAEVRWKTGDLESGIREMAALVETAGLEQRIKADALDWLGMAEWERGDTTMARHWFGELDLMSLDLGRRRTADLHLEAVGQPDPVLRDLLMEFYLEDSDPAVRPVVLLDIIRKYDSYWPASYLMGRHLFNRSEYFMAVPYLQKAAGMWPDRSGLKSDTVGRENMRLLGVCLAIAGKADEAGKVLSTAAQGGSPAWAAHIEFLKRVAAGAHFSGVR